MRSDYGSVVRYRRKYHPEEPMPSQLGVDLIRKIGFQMMTATRVMRFLRDAGVPLAPQVASRLIRHLYAAEIHWDTEIADGVSVVHGNGLVLSRAARVGPGCILFQNVTLGEGRHPDTKEVGAPTLERDVHVGPGATLIGPIVVGEGSKIMGGVVVTRSVPPHSVVKAPAPEVAVRGPAEGGAARASLAGGAPSPAGASPLRN